MSENLEDSFPPFDYSGVIISSRVRLARNIYNIPFPNKATLKELRKVMEDSYRLFKDLPDYSVYRLEEMKDEERMLLFEKHLISEQAAEVVKATMLVLNGQLNRAIIVNEEDHFRIQVYSTGSPSREMIDEIFEIDDFIGKKFRYGFDRKLGYLTACPTNLGTGMRISAIVHIPAICLSGRLDDLIKHLKDMHFTLRGTYGEGSSGYGHLFQVSNQVTLGRTENEILKEVKKVLEYVKEGEEEIRKSIYGGDRATLMDVVARSLGALKNARRINYSEAVNCISFVKMGEELGIIKNINKDNLKYLFFKLKPVHLSRFYGDGRLKKRERKEKRANILRDTFKSVRIAD